MRWMELRKLKNQQKNQKSKYFSSDYMDSFECIVSTPRPSKSLEKVTFRQVILAVHRHAILGLDLANDLTFQQSRLIHKNRVSNFRLQIALLVLKGRTREAAVAPTRDFNIGTSSSEQQQYSAADFCLLMQRFDPVLYKSTFVRLMKGVLTYLRQTMYEY